MLKRRWINLLQALKASELAGIAIMPGPNMFYMTGLFMGLSERPTLLTVHEEGKASLIMPVLESQKAS